jgi:hypothetical protein
MNSHRKLLAALAATGLGLGACSIALAGSPAPEVSKGTAQATALTAVPLGTVQSAELESEHGKRIWSFDIARPRSTQVVEVQVDAQTGAIVSKKLESASEQRSEARADAKSK